MADNEVASLSGAAQVLEFLREHSAAEMFDVVDPRGTSHAEAVPFAVVPIGKKIESLAGLMEPYLKAPTRRRGQIKCGDAASFITIVNRFGGKRTLVFADPSPNAPALVAVFNHHEEGEFTKEAGFGDHKALYSIRLSDQWKAWNGVAGNWLSQAEFAEFLEDHIQDVVLVDTNQEPKLSDLVQLLGGKVANAGKLMELSRGLAVSRGIKVHNAVTLASGEVNIQYVEQHNDGAGQPLSVPNLFFLGIPIFYNGTAYRVPVRLRYRFAEGALRWSVIIHRPDLLFEDAFSGVRKEVEKATSVVLVNGAPEQ